MAQRVLDERLQQQRRHLEPPAGVVDVVRDLQAIAEPRALEIDVALDHAQLVAERRELPGGPIERRPHEVAQPEQHGQRRRVAVGANLRGDRVQRVEQEVRLDFQPQRVERGARQLGFELCLAKLEPPGALVRRECASADDEEAGDEGIDQHESPPQVGEGLPEAVERHGLIRLKPDRHLFGDGVVRERQ